MVAEANYGGRVTDPNDRAAIILILEDSYNPQMLKPNQKLVESGKSYVTSEGPLDTYVDLIREQVPLNDLTEVFGVHDHAEITAALNLTNDMLGAA